MIDKIEGFDVSREIEIATRNPEYAEAVLSSRLPLSWDLLDHIRDIGLTEILSEKSSFPTPSNIGDLLTIKELRKSFGVTQAAFAELFGITRSYLSRIENGKHHVPHEVSRWCTEWFGVSLYSTVKSDLKDGVAITKGARAITKALESAGISDALKRVFEEDEKLSSETLTVDQMKSQIIEMENTILKLRAEAAEMRAEMNEKLDLILKNIGHK